MRIERDVIDIDEKLTSNFWEKRARRGLKLKTVLLNETLDDEILQKRNNKELDIVKSVLPENASILDIGCGLGRWADNLKNDIKFYQGIDNSVSLIEIARKRFEENDNIEFLNMSASKIIPENLNSDFDVAIITGVMMYINDKDIFGILDYMNRTVDKFIYIQESICTKEGRLTLDNIYSESLSDNYSAIYRTQEEYENFYKKSLTNFIIEKTDLLLDNEMSLHEETNARYWILKRVEK